MNFEEIGVMPPIVKALREMGITAPTEIQAKAIPIIKQGKDLIGMSKTGSGKTAAFGIPLVEMISPGRGIQVVVLAPTRELVHQISQELQKYSKYLTCNIATVYGGVSMNPQIQEMAHAEIIIATPGRLLDHLQRRTVSLSTISHFVLDEADKMVEMGFIEDVERILSATSEERQIILFGATLSKEIEHIQQRYMHEPVTVEAELQVKEDLLEQYYYNVDQREKFSLLVHLLKKEKRDLTIIFCSKRSTVEMLTKNLRLNGVKAEMIHGKMTQNRRLHVIDQFHKGKTSVLVASSVAARGLDVKDVSHVFNYDLAQDPQEYVHRIGRTARAGESGKAITLLSHQDHDAFRQILSRYRLTVQELPKENYSLLRFVTRFENQQHRRDGGFHRGNRFQREEPRNERRFPPRRRNFSRSLTRESS
ncbi:DEAD/DEAH box helicase [Candidatus Woesearchaeota archaeon]|nr:DEAD/DEAH box helicase [Candidatus Woesearchaeota archaeon]